MTEENSSWKDELIEELINACIVQHEAIDRLAALLMQKDSKFLLSKSGQVWEAVIKGNNVIEKVETLKSQRRL